MRLSRRSTGPGQGLILRVRGRALPISPERWGMSFDIIARGRYETECSLQSVVI